MGHEFAVPLLAMMAAVVLAGMVDEAAMPAYMTLGCLAMLLALLVVNGAVTMAPNMVQGLTLAAAGFALFGHVRGARRS